MSASHADGSPIWRAVKAIGVILGIIGSLITVYLFVQGTIGPIKPSVAGGPIWRVTSSPNPGPDNNELASVAALAPDNVWAVGNSRNKDYTTQVLLEHWGGSSWAVFSSPNSGRLSGIAALAPNDIWAVGDQDSGGLIEHWDGSSWSVVSHPNPGSALNELFSIAALAPNNVWTIGDYRNNEESYQVLIEHWNGSSWSVVSSPHTGSLWGIAAPTPNDIWAVGNQDTRTLIEHWDGSTWTAVSGPDQGFLTGVAELTPNDIWAVGSSGTYESLTEHWDGTRWKVVSSPNPGPSGNGLQSVTALTPNNVWAVGDYLGGGFRHTLILRFSK